jgi:hypothetical protein
MDEREHNSSPVPSEGQPPSEGEKSGSAINAEVSATQSSEPATAKLVENDPVVLDAAPPPCPIAAEASSGNPLDALDQFSRAFHHDLERPADLLE